MSGKIFVISAPSGAGKTTLVNRVVSTLSPHISIQRVITYTSRAQRDGEQHGRDYFFISPQDFERKIEQGFFIEWSTAYGTYYGSPRSIIDDARAGLSCLLVVDRAGARNVLGQAPDAELIWIEVASVEILRARLQGRGDKPESIERRLKLAIQEMKEESNSPFYSHYVRNHELQEACSQLEALIKRCLLKESS